MKINLLIFGRLTEITGKNTLTLTGINDTSSLIKEMHEKYPGLAESKYVISVDKKMIRGNTKLNENSTVALMPPFSGG